MIQKSAADQSDWDHDPIDSRATIKHCELTTVENRVHSELKIVPISVGFRVVQPFGQHEVIVGRFFNLIASVIGNEKASENVEVDGHRLEEVDDLGDVHVVGREKTSSRRLNETFKQQPVDEDLQVAEVNDRKDLQYEGMASRKVEWQH